MQPSQKQLFFVLKNRVEMMDDEMKDVLWTAYQRKRDQGRDFGPLELDIWESFLSLEKMSKAQAEEEQQQMNDKIVDLTLSKRMDDLEGTVALLQETLQLLIEQNK